MICDFSEGTIIDYEMFNLYGHVNIMKYVLHSYNDYTYDVWFDKDKNEFISTFLINKRFGMYYIFDRNNIINVCENIGFELELLKKPNYHLTVELFTNKDKKEIFNINGKDMYFTVELNKQPYKSIIKPDCISNACKLIGFHLTK